MVKTKHELTVTIPENHQLRIELPDSVRTGPARLVLEITSLEESAGAAEEVEAMAETPLQRWIRVADALKADGRSLKELSPEEQQERLAMLRGIGRGLLPSSEEMARAKRAEIELEDPELADS